VLKLSGSRRSQSFSGLSQEEIERINLVVTSLV
jgi:hypothetical protein